MWTDIVDQARAVTILQQQIQNDRISHAYLFAGPRGVGKRETALQMAKAMLCSTPSAGDNCERCNHCLRINSGNHPDVYVIEPDGASIKKEQIEKLHKEFSYQAMETKRKIYIILAAETMTMYAANQLLKFLEEPDGIVTAILVSDRPQNVLPTLRSRCQRISFQDLPWQHIAEQAIARGVAAADARIASHIAKNVEEVIALSTREEFAQLRKIVIQFYQEDFRQKGVVLQKLHQYVLSDAKLKEDFHLFLELSVLWFRDVLSVQLDREQDVVNIDVLPIVQKQAKTMLAKAIAKTITILLQTGERLKWMNQPLALEQMSMQLADVHAGS